MHVRQYSRSSGPVRGRPKREHMRQSAEAGRSALAGLPPGPSPGPYSSMPRSRSTTFSMMESAKMAMIGEKSIPPSGGTKRRNRFM